MKKLFILLFCSSIALLSQEVIFEKEYSQLPFELRIENSGIYSIASFDIDKDRVYFSSFTAEGIFEYRNGKFTINQSRVKMSNDFLSGIDKQNSSFIKRNKISLKRETLLLKKNFIGGKSVLKDNGGNIRGAKGEEMLISVPNRSQLIIKSNIEELNNEITLNFPSNLACADLIGIDESGDIFVLVEKYISEIPLKVKREVYAISKSGDLLSRILLPNIKYLYTLKDLQIDSAGNLYHLLSFADKVQIVKWGNLTEPDDDIIKYPAEYSAEIHFDNYTPINEPAGKIQNNADGIKTVSSRTEALRIAETYVLHQYECSPSNLAPNDITAPDGDIVRTPPWLIVGMNARIPYRWGGFNTLSQFDAGLRNGRYAGDINTNGVSSYAVGVDCSGFVSRCWQMSYHASTAYMPNITTQYNSWDDLKPGDAIHKVGHVRLFVERNINGSFKVVESTGRGWGVSYWSYFASDLSAYTPRYYDNMESNYNGQRPALISAELKPENKVLLNWNCDTTNILGYRVYGSEDGKYWNMIIDENNCTTTYAEIGLNSPANYFRISSVKNNTADLEESNWSNVLGAGSYSSEKKVLIVDGFERESGSWRGPGESFVLKYGKAIEELKTDFVSIKNSELLNGSFKLENYDYVFWILGDESTVDETFNFAEQTLVKKYLESGGGLFVSGSEIGWDLDHKGDTQDRSFYHNYLKAKYISDDANSNSVIGAANSVLEDCNFYIGQTYEEDYPDEIEPRGGSVICMKYANGKVAGIQYSGYFGDSTNQSALIYLGFPLETTANDEAFDEVIAKSVNYFNSPIVGIDEDNIQISGFELWQNYPNPFNPTTKIKFSVPSVSRFASDSFSAAVTVYDVLGREIAAFVKRVTVPGTYELTFDGSELPSGIYFYRLTIFTKSVGRSDKLTIEDFSSVKKMTLLK